MLSQLLAGGDLRRIGNSNQVAAMITSQALFNQLFELLFQPERLIAMRAADVIEKVTIKKPQYLVAHKQELFNLCARSKNKELKWHLALLLSRLDLNFTEAGAVRQILTDRVKDDANSVIVRVNALQGIAELPGRDERNWHMLLNLLQLENIPAINAGIRKVKK